jgi:hypothetical protein
MEDKAVNRQKSPFSPNLPFGGEIDKTEINLNPIMLRATKKHKASEGTERGRSVEAPSAMQVREAPPQAAFG